MAALLKALPALLAMIVALLDLVRAAQAKGAAIDTVVAEVLGRATDDIRRATAATIAAETEHSGHPDDSAFDGDFERKDP